MAGAGLLIPSALAACSRTEPGSGASAEDTLKKIKEQGYVTVGFAGERPFGYKDGDKITGQGPELHKAIWATLGVKEVRGKLVEFGSLIPGLNANRFDSVAAGMYITPERCAQAQFSEPEYNMPESFLVAKGNPKNITDYESLKKSGAKMGTLGGAVEVGYAKEFKISGVQTYDDVVSGRQAVESGRIDAFAGTTLTLSTSLKEKPSGKLEVSEPFFPVIGGEKVNGAGASVFRKKDTSLREAYDKGLAELKSSGELLKILAPFGFTEDMLPGDDLTMKGLCAG